jgi:hypothetical protein
MHLVEERTAQGASLSEPQTLAVEFELGVGVVAADGVDEGRGGESAAQGSWKTRTAQRNPALEDYVAVLSLAIASD